MKLSYSYPSQIGTVQIKKVNAYWRVLVGEEDLGAYGSPEMALDDIIGGHTFSHSSGIDTSTLDLPTDLSEWN